MKKILEVLQYGDDDIRFNTDVKVMKNPSVVERITIDSAMAMTTTLWGGNENDVLAVIRALSIADLGVSVNRSYMLKYLDESSKALADSLALACEDMRRKGGKILTFGPGINPMGNES